VLNLGLHSLFPPSFSDLPRVDLDLDIKLYVAVVIDTNQRIRQCCTVGCKKTGTVRIKLTHFYNFPSVKSSYER
jgi:hypothetical protein